MTESHNLSTTSISFGPGGEIINLPAGFKQETVLVASNAGVTSAMLAWGTLAREVHSPQEPKIADTALTSLGYWTDNGAAYYWYNYGDHVKPLEPQVKLEQVMATYKALQVPVNYFQLDGWWYKTNTCTNGFACACIVNFAPDPSSFNHSGPGIPYPVGVGPWFNQSLESLAADIGIEGWSLYQNYFCPTSDYSNNFSFILDRYKVFAHVVPDQAEDFFTQVWGQGAAQSAVGFEWDYQSTSYDDMPHYRNNVTAASLYMAGMAAAAEKHGTPIQYCMSYPRHILESMKHRVVTNARASPDYANSGANLVEVAYTSLLYQAVGIAPSKDSFFTAGGQWSRAHAIVAALSTGPVGPSDKVELIGNHSEYLTAACNKEGRLLQPTTPISTIDAKYSLNPSTAVPARSHVWAASSTISGATAQQQQQQAYTSHTVLSMFLPREGFQLWRNSTHPQMDAGATYVYRTFGQAPCSNDSVVFRTLASGTGSDGGSGSGSGAPFRGATAWPPKSNSFKCTVEDGFDQTGGIASGAPIPNISKQGCCNACAQNPQCTAWVYGPLGGVDTCFPAADVRGKVASADRSFCCMGKASSAGANGASSGSSVTATPQKACATLAPVGAPIPLSTWTPQELNCTGGSGGGSDGGGEQLVSIFPVVHGFALLGETDKWVHASPNRFSNISITPAELSVTITGSVGEVVTVTVLANGAPQVHSVSLKTTTARLSVSS
jgi:hypothetical protein